MVQQPAVEFPIALRRTVNYWPGTEQDWQSRKRRIFCETANNENMVSVCLIVADGKTKEIYGRCEVAGSAWVGEIGNWSTGRLRE